MKTLGLIVAVLVIALLVSKLLGADHGPPHLGGDLLHPGIGLVLLLFIQILNVYKPAGTTGYGWRKQQQQSSLAPIS